MDPSSYKRQVLQVQKGLTVHLVNFQLPRGSQRNYNFQHSPRAGRCVVVINVASGLPGVVVHACALARTALPRSPRASSSSPSRPPLPPLFVHRFCSSAAASMLPAALLRRSALGRLVRQVRAYAEAAAAPAPAAGPGQMSFTFASPTQVRTPPRCHPGARAPISGLQPPSVAPFSPLPPVWSRG